MKILLESEKVLRSIPSRLVNRMWKDHPPVIRNVRDWVAQTGMGSCVDITRPTVLNLPLPEGYCGEDTVFAREQSSTLPGRYLARIPNAVIRGWDGFVVLPDGGYCLENTTEKWLLPNPFYWQRIQAKPVRLPGPWFSLMSMHCREHYHWMHDVLTRLHRVLELLPPETQFLIPDGTKEERLDLLEAVGVGRDRLVFYDPLVAVEVDELFFAPFSAPHRFSDPEAVTWVREKLRAHFQLKPQAKEKIYISRQNAPNGRALEGEAEIVPLLQKNGFRILLAEKHSLEEQAKIFAGASHILGCHGAGFTNMLFAESGSRAWEIFPEEIGFRTYFWTLAHACGIRYGYAKGESVVLDERRTNIRFSKERFSAILQNFCNT